MKDALSYDDVLLKPHYSDIRSRAEVDMSAVLMPAHKIGRAHV